MQQSVPALLPERYLHLREPAHMALTLGSHFVYSAAVGALYPPTTHHLPLSSALRGATYGLAVWALGYLGWLLLAGILPLATRRPIRHTAIMFPTYLGWGQCWLC